MRISDWSSDVCSSDLFHEARMFGEVADRIAAVEEDAFVAVDIGQLRFAARGRGEAGIIGERAGLGVEFADIDDVGADGARQDRAVDGRVAQRDFRGVGHILFPRSEEHTSELQSLMRISYAVFCLKKKKQLPYSIRKLKH